ncbi:hypothetical protein EHS25_007641 [Saitozyma podzolica]|uniref:Cytochrome c oxidase assembly protein COX20, mitochondrial n=1 Tax=Saitozyma podzolica TaxID=1890683 RepID=A0A427YQE6_9TREE|nr:hypothetical protein EHS25_007641 [Saitozyma podzolica]
MSQPSSSRSPILNIPSGNSTVSEETDVRPSEDGLSGDRVKDYWAALQRVDVARDLENIGQIPCARNSLLYGIAGGAGVGAVRFISSRSEQALLERRPRVVLRAWLTGQGAKLASNWAVGAFVGIAIVQWQLCNNARAKELQQMRMIQEKFSHRHASKLKRGMDAKSERGGVVDGM